MAYILLRRLQFCGDRSGRTGICGCRCVHIRNNTKLDLQTKTSKFKSCEAHKIQEEIIKARYLPICNSLQLLNSTPSLLTCNYLHEDWYSKRLFHYSAYILKEDSLVEKSVKALKSEAEKEKQDIRQQKVDDKAAVAKKGYLQTKKEKWGLTLVEMQKIGYLKYTWQATKAVVNHYMDGFKLFYANFRICIPLLIKYIKNGRSSLKRREYNLLIKTIADLIRMVPLLPMIVIPFGELLIPFYISLGMMPSVFLGTSQKDEKNRQKLQKKLEYSALLAESLQDTPLKKTSGTSSIQDFTKFMDKIKSSKTMPANEEILKFSRLFEDSLTLDDLNVMQLQGLCKLLGIGFLGKIPNVRILRFQIGIKLRELAVDDRMIQKEGIDSLTTVELQTANRSRGMRAIGVSEERLQFQLQQWLELHLNENVPTSLLLLSRVMYLDENLSPAEQLTQTISALPDTTVDKVKVTSAASQGEDVDTKIKIKVLEEEQKALKQEKEEEEKEREAATHVVPVGKKKTVLGTAEPQHDMAEPIIAKASEELPKEKVDVEQITPNDIGAIEKAIETMAIHHKNEFADVKEDLKEYIEDVEDIKAMCLKKEHEQQIKETLGAQQLRTKLNKYLSKLDANILKLQEEKQILQDKLEQQQVNLRSNLGLPAELEKSISDKKSNLITINDVLFSLSRLQKVPDDVHMQKVLEILDTDQDGQIDINDVLKITEAVGRENLNLNKDQVTAMMTLLRNEETLAQEKKLQEKEEKGLLNETDDKVAEGKGSGTRDT